MLLPWFHSPINLFYVSMLDLVSRSRVRTGVRNHVMGDVLPARFAASATDIFNVLDYGGMLLPNNGFEWHPHSHPVP
jgi:hypothetical protein